MKFTESEIAFLRRYCWELCYLGSNSRPTERYGHYSDLADLAHVAGVLLEVAPNWGRGELTDPAPPEVPFPWESPDHLGQRAHEVRKAFPDKFDAEYIERMWKLLMKNQSQEFPV